MATLRRRIVGQNLDITQQANLENWTMKGLKLLAVVLLVVGGLNWGLVGTTGFDLVRALFGDMTVLSRIVYSLVGAAAIYQLATLFAGNERGTARAVNATR